MICSYLVKSCILRSLVYFLIMFYNELIPFQIIIIIINRYFKRHKDY
jgi:hypothetical protein